MASTGGEPPELLDPFAGGGAIPLEGQRLGLKVHAHDLNPVAVMINKAMIEIPPRFAGLPPVDPEARSGIGDGAGWEGASGLAEDVRYYGEWMKREAFKRIAHLYPKVQTPSGDATVIAWIWARTVKCPNPACGCEMPLASSFILSKKKGKEAYVAPIIEDGKIRYEVRLGTDAPEASKIAKGRFKCVACGAVASNEYLHEQFTAGKHGKRLMAVVAEGRNGRLYLSPDEEQLKASICDLPENYPDQEMNQKTTDLVSGRGYGFTHWYQLFTPRQLTMLTTFSDLIAEAQKEVERDARDAGMSGDDTPLADGGTGAFAYGQAVGVYLAFAVDRVADFSTQLSRWSSSNEKVMNLFSKQSIPMVWDYSEANVFGNSVGDFGVIVKYIASCLETIPVNSMIGTAQQVDAREIADLHNVLVSTDPPYYDNIGYADLSDFFYIWLRRSLRSAYPDLFQTMLVPKVSELIATPYRHDGDMGKAKAFFEDGMLQACENLYQNACDDVPVTIYYAYKQSETENDGQKEQTASSGWETMLSAIIKAGFAITGTWPMRTEQAYRTNSMETNALASSIVLVCRKRPADAPSTTKRDFRNELKQEMRSALKKLYAGNISPVDVRQAAIGPGMAVFSKYAQVLEADGNPMTVRDALKMINEAIDIDPLDLDSESRFCLDLYAQRGFDVMKFGDAQVIATANSISIQALASKGALYAQRGDVHLMDREEIEVKVSDEPDIDWLLTQRLTKAMAMGGREACAKVLVPVMGAAERAKALAYRLYSIAERKGWAAEAYAYNSLVTDWGAVMDRARQLQDVPAEQLSMGFELDVTSEEA